MKWRAARFMSKYVRDQHLETVHAVEHVNVLKEMHPIVLMTIERTVCGLKPTFTPFTASTQDAVNCLECLKEIR